MSADRTRGYSPFTITKMDEEKREIRGIATTPTPDRVGDIVEPLGAEFSLPMPLLWQHRHDQPVGTVEMASATEDGIEFVAKIAQIDEPGTLKDRVDEAWQSVKTGLVRAVSIGFGINEYSIMDDGGWRFTSWDWRELSLVTIPANAEATINVIRSADAKARAALGNGSASKADESPCVKGNQRPQTGKKVKLLTPEGDKPMAPTFKEQIEALEATKASKHARIDDMLEKSAADGETFSDEEAEEYDGLVADVKSIDAHVARLADMGERKASDAKPVDGASPKSGTASRAGAKVKAPKAEKGIAFARYAKAIYLAEGNPMQAAEIAKRWEDTPEVHNVLKAAVSAGTTTDPSWAGNLAEYNNMTGEFIELLRPMTFMEKIDGWRASPFKVSLPRFTSGTTGYWVGEGQWKPVSAGATDRVTLDRHKIAAISAVTEELARESTPEADAWILQDLLQAVAQRQDESLIDPAFAGVANVSPASLTNGVPGITSSGTDAIAVRTDLAALIGAFIANNTSVAGAVIVMQEGLALTIGLMRNNLGQKEFPDLNMSGGFIEGIPVVTSQNAPAGQITMIKPSQVLLARDNNIMLDTSREASLVMDDDPQNVADPKSMVSMWQTNQLALRAERYITWTKAYPGAVQLVTGAAYAL